MRKLPVMVFVLGAAGCRDNPRGVANQSPASGASGKGVACGMIRPRG